MKKTKYMKEQFLNCEVKELTATELKNIDGGGTVWEFLGKVARGFVEFSKGAADGGYAYCKC